MTDYPVNATLEQARTLYFEANGFGADGGYEAAWVDFKLGSIPFPFPNTPPRKRAVRLHDLHHIATGYRTDFLGELEISAWEIGSGCKGYAAAWQLNLGGMAMGALLIPRRTFRAFLRGRHSDNFYSREYGPDLLALQVGSARRELRLDRDEAWKATPTDMLLYALALVTGWTTGLISFVLFVPLAVVAWPFLNWAASRRKRAAGASASARARTSTEPA